jgi:vanillate O-demethylase monooxygenase subunit
VTTAPSVAAGWVAVAPAAALDGADRLVVRVGDDPWVLVRLDGEWTALRDRCPHRRVPLSAGTVVDTADGQRLECGYHGWAFDGTGRCTAVPALGSGRVPAGMRVAAAAVEVRDGLVHLLPSPSAP